MMKRLINATVLTVILAMLVAPVAAAAGLEAPVLDDRVVIGGNETIEEGETVDGNLIVFGGNVTVEEGAEVTGDVVVFGGNAAIDGEIGGNVIGFGGNAAIGNDADVAGDVVSFGGIADIAEGADVDGEIISGSPSFEFDGAPPIVIEGPGILTPNWWLGEIQRFAQAILSAVAQALALGLLAFLLYLFVPDPMDTVAATIAEQPFPSFGLGLVAWIIIPVLAIGFVFTCILSPISALAMIALALVSVYGWIVLGTLVGRRLLESSSLRADVAIGLGTFIITLLAGVLSEAPLIGWLFGLLRNIAILVGAGAVLLSRFGTQPYRTNPPAGTGVAPPLAVPPPPPVTPSAGE